MSPAYATGINRVHRDNDAVGAHTLFPNPCTSPVDRVATQRPGNLSGTIR
jgi:hypothetical protein